MLTGEGQEEETFKDVGNVLYLSSGLCFFVPPSFTEI